MRLVGAVAVLLRRLRGERGVVAFLFVLVAVTSLVVAASPRLFGRVADEGLRYAVSRSTATQRNIQFSTVVRSIPSGSDPMVGVVNRGDTLAGRLPASVTDIVTARHYVVDTTRFRLVDPPNYTSFVTLRTQEGVNDQIDLTQGRLPAAVPAPADPVDPRRFEIAVSAPTAAELLVGVGDVLPAAVDPGDPMLRNVFPKPVAAVELEVVGTFTLRDPEADYWFDESAVARPAIGGSDDTPIAFATALFAPEAYGDLRTLGLPNRYRWQFHVDAARLDAARLPALEADLRRLETTFTTTGTGLDGQVVYRTGLLDLVDDFLTERVVTEATLSVAAIGPLAVAAGAVGLVGLIIVRRRRAALTLARGRGASARQLLAAQLWEGLLVTVPAALVGLVVAQLAVPARSDPISSIGAILVALAVTALLIAATWPLARRARRELERPELPGGRLAPRRLVFEATIVGVAIGAVWLLRERGIGGRPTDGGPPAFDPFLAAAPVLLGVATGLLTIRLYPFPVRVIGWLTARRRDLVPVLGLRNIGRNPGAAYLPLLVLTVTVAIGVFSSVVAVTIDRGQVAASWQDVGADYRIEGTNDGPIANDVDPRIVPGVEAAARALVTATSSVVGQAERAATTTLMAVDPADFVSVVDGSPVALRLPPAVLAAPTDAGVGTPEHPIPVVVSRRLPNGWTPLAIDEVFQVGLGNQPLALTVAGFVDDVPGIRRGATFILAPFASVAAAREGPAIRPSAWFVRGAPELGPTLRTALDAPTVGRIVSRHEGLAVQRAAPLIAAVGQGFLIALGAAAAYAGLAVVAVIALDAGRRARELAFLRTLGLGDRQAIALTIVEHAPPALVALAVGLVLGLAVAWLLAPGLGLGAFIGPGAPVVLQVDWTSVAAVVLSVLAVITLMVVVSSWLARRLDPGQALRIGDG